MSTPVSVIFFLEGIVTLLSPLSSGSVSKILPCVIRGLFIGSRSCFSELSNDDMCFDLYLYHYKFIFRFLSDFPQQTVSSANHAYVRFFSPVSPQKLSQV
uniref:Uncharacterized protein n=1 Tax=Oryza nivara TaxID=4536 RepID=A0A0E0GGV8_ORYNI